MLEVRGLTKWFGGFRAVAGVSFTVSPGEVLGYVGPNGSGKTTTVNMVTGLIPPTAGEVRFNGSRIDADLVAFRRHVGCVPEEPHLYPYLSGREHLELVAGLRGMDERIAARRIDALLNVLGLDVYGDASMSSYSKGMRQKILIAAALLPDPPLLVFDEPMSGLDAASALVFRHLVSALGARPRLGREDLLARARAQSGYRRGPGPRRGTQGAVERTLARGGVQAARVRHRPGRHRARPGLGHDHRRVGRSDAP